MNDSDKTINYYQILGLNSSATDAEIRRAYRILARRYHPDVNPGEASVEKFKAIAEAYDVLSDPVKRKQFDIMLERQQGTYGSKQFHAYQEHIKRRTATEKYYQAQKADYEQIKAWQGQAGSRPRASFKPQEGPSSKIERPSRTAQSVNLKRDLKFPGVGLDLKERLLQANTALQGWLGKVFPSLPQQKTANVTKISILETSVTINDIINGARKTIEIEEPEGRRKIKVKIPIGTRDGALLRLKSTTCPNEEIVVIVRVAKHPFLSIQPRGLTLQVPITIGEAISGATISIPTLKEPASLKIPPNTQSGSEFRLKGSGLPEKEGAGDLIVRVLVRVPESSNAVGIKEKAVELDRYYEQGVRQNLPKSLLQF